MANFKLNTFKRNNLFKYLYFKLFKPKLKFSEEDITLCQLHRKDEAIFLKYKTNEFEDSINKEFNYWAETTEAEYLIHYNKKCTIEPYSGWVFNESNQIIRRSMPYGISDITPLPHYIFYKRKKFLTLDRAISMYYNWFNYWHFLNDTIGQLYLLEKLQFDKSVPIIVPAKALTVAYARDFFETEFSREWNWIFQQDDIYVRLNSVYFCKSISNVKDHMIYAAKIFTKMNSASKTTDQKVFITRSPVRGRDVINIEELKPLIQAYGFEIVECEQLSIFQQSKLFASCNKIMGIHGAGLTNMIFRYPKTCKVMEIFPPGYHPTHYYWLAKELGFSYSAISGNELRENKAFYLSKEVLENFLRTE